jgi:hypothetical protein
MRGAWELFATSEVVRCREGHCDPALESGWFCEGMSAVSAVSRNTRCCWQEIKETERKIDAVCRWVSRNTATSSSSGGGAGSTEQEGPPPQAAPRLKSSGPLNGTPRGHPLPTLKPH